MSWGIKAKIWEEVSPLERSQLQERASVKRMLMRVYPVGMVLAAVTGTMTEGHSEGKAGTAEVVADPPLPLPPAPLLEESDSEGRSEVVVSDVCSG